MALNINTGVVDSADRLSTEVVAGASDYLNLVDLDSSPFYSILKALPSPAAKAVRVEWADQRVRYRHSFLGASITNVATSMTVATGHGGLFKVGDLAVLGLPDAKQELLQVTGITADAVGITRSVGEVPAASAASGAALMILGPVAAQGADLVASNWVTPANGYNYTQVFRTPAQFTGTEFQIAKHGQKKGNSRSIAFALVDHIRQVEATAFFGGRSYSTAGTHPLHTMGGVQEFVVPQILGSLSSTAFSAAIDNAMAAGSGKKAFFCGSAFAAQLKNVYPELWRGNEGDRKRFGVRPDWYYDSEFGSIPGFTEATWTQSYSVTAEATGYAAKGAAFLVDLGLVRLRPLRETALLKNRQGPGEDKVTFEWMTELSLEVSTPEAHASMQIA